MFEPVVFIKNYLGSGNDTVGVLQPDGDSYMLGDGDCHERDQMGWLGDEVRFITYKDLVKVLGAQS